MMAWLTRADVRTVLSVIMVTGVMAMAFYLAVTKPDSDIFKIMLGTIIGTSLSSVVNFYFGSSQGSAMKDEALARTTAAQTETIQQQSVALAASVPAAEPQKP